MIVITIANNTNNWHLLNFSLCLTLYGIISLNSTKLYKIGTIVVFILQRKKLRHREVTLLAQGHTTSE